MKKNFNWKIPREDIKKCKNISISGKKFSSIKIYNDISDV